jgi:hypothetical protein
MSNGRSPRDVVEAWRKRPAGVAIPSAFLDLCRIESDMADQPISGPMMTFMALFGDVLALHEQAARMREAGWLPHPVLPISDLVGPEKDLEKIRAAIDAHVEKQRDEIYAALTARFSGYALEAYTCQIGMEAISAHRAGLYRLVVPAVFPEIERCGRTMLHLGVNKKGKAVIDQLIERIKRLPLSELDAFLAMEAIKLMEEQMYTGIRSREDVERFQELPHRHGSQHGLSMYERSRDGLNAIFLLDFVLLACTAATPRHDVRP